MQEVQVLEATRTAPNSRGRVRSNPITVERIRVAAYVRAVSYTHLDVYKRQVLKCVVVCNNFPYSTRKYRYIYVKRYY